MKNTAKRTESGQAEEVPVRLPGLEAMRAGLHALVVTAGLEMLGALLERDREALCGPRYQHEAERPATRAGHARGELAFGGRRVAVQRPRVRADGREVPLPAWQALAAHDPLPERAVEQMLVGVSTREYGRSLEKAPPGVEMRGDSRSAVSRRFVAATEARVQEALHASLAQLALCVLMIDGLVVDEHTMLIALGIDEQGHKHILGLHEGATENEASCLALLANLEERGLKLDRPLLIVIDGSPALRSAVRKKFGRKALVQRCQVHKVRNVLDHLPERERARVRAAMQTAYQSTSEERARRLLHALARQLEVKHPSAAASLREGLDETLTVLRLGLDGSLLRTLATTNPIENLNGLVRRRTRRVKRWRSGTMIERWLVAALDDARRGFRRVRGYEQIPALLTALATFTADDENASKANPLDNRTSVREAA
jgi:putative transposase